MLKIRGTIKIIRTGNETAVFFCFVFFFHSDLETKINEYLDLSLENNHAKI